MLTYIICVVIIEVEGHDWQQKNSYLLQNVISAAKLVLSAAKIIVFSKYYRIRMGWDGMGYTVGTGVATNRINNYVLSKGRRPYYGVYSRCSQRRQNCLG